MGQTNCKPPSARADWKPASNWPRRSCWREGFRFKQMSALEHCLYVFAAPVVCPRQDKDHGPDPPKSSRRQGNRHRRVRSMSDGTESPTCSTGCSFFDHNARPTVPRHSLINRHHVKPGGEPSHRLTITRRGTGVRSSNTAKARGRAARIMPMPRSTVAMDETLTRAAIVRVPADVPGLERRLPSPKIGTFAQRTGA